MTPNVQTLTQRFAAGRMPWNEALRFGSQIIDSLRHAHEEGCCHGALTPDAVTFSATGVELVPAQVGGKERVTPYTAPECLAGREADARSDIFSLGAILYEMFTGRPAFGGQTPEEVAASLQESTPEPIGDTGLDRLVLNCLVKDPAGRWQRVQQVHMEFRILTFSAKRVQQLSVSRQRELATQTELRKVEGQLSLRLDQQAGDLAAGLREITAQLPVLEAQLAARLDQQSAETTAGLRHMAAELPRMESHLASRLAEQYGEAMSSLQHLAAELPLVEGRLLARLDQQEGELARVAARLDGHDGALAAVPELKSRLDQHDGALAAVPELESRLAARLDQHDDALAAVPELESRLDQHDGALAAVPELKSRLDQHDDALAAVPELKSRLEQHDGALAAVPELESRIAARLDQHDGALASVSELKSRIEQHDGALAAVQELKSRLDQHEGALAGIRELSERLEQHDGALTSVQHGLSELPLLAARIEEHQSAFAAVPAIESRLAAEIAQQNSLADALQRASAERHSVVDQVSHSVSDVQEKVDSLEIRFAAAHKSARNAEQAADQFVEIQGSLIEEMRELGSTVKSQAVAIESIQTAMARTDDFMERVVEALESLQNMVLEQARDRVGA